MNVDIVALRHMGSLKLRHPHVKYPPPPSRLHRGLVLDVWPVPFSKALSNVFRGDICTGVHNSR
jgi:hypothetical protein